MRGALLFLAAFAAAGASAAAAGSQTPVVSCWNATPVGSSPGPAAPRIVLGRLAMAPAQLPYVIRRSDVRPFRWWSKAPLAIRPDTPGVAISVPRAWRGRVAFTYGNVGPAVSAVRFAGCRPSGGAWNAYPGGFFTTTRVCFPLDVRIAGHATTIRIGMDARC